MSKHSQVQNLALNDILRHQSVSCSSFELNESFGMGRKPLNQELNCMQARFHQILVALPPILTYMSSIQCKRELQLSREFYCVLGTRNSGRPSVRLPSADVRQMSQLRCMRLRRQPIAQLLSLTSTLHSVHPRWFLPINHTPLHITVIFDSFCRF